MVLPGWTDRPHNRMAVMTVKTPMTTGDQQEAFDLLASLIERQADTGNFDEHNVWWEAQEFCNKFRDCDMITRERYLSDFSSRSLLDEDGCDTPESVAEKCETARGILGGGS